jgi:hypothetical protein
MKILQWLVMIFILPIIILNASDLDKLTKYNSKHYTFYTQLDNEWNKNLGKMMDAYFEYLCRSFQLKDDGRCSKIIVFTDRNAFVEYGRKETGGASDNWAGYYNSSLSQPELVIHFTGKDFNTFFHEGLHQILHRLFPNINYWPSWINEGMASYMEYTQYTNDVIVYPEQSTWYYRNTMLTIKKAGRIKLDEFLKVSHANWNRSGYDYAMGAVFFDFLLNTKNTRYKNLIKDFMSALQSSQSYDQAYSQTFGRIDLNELTKEFLKFMDV